MNDRLQALRLFVRAARLASFSAAAREFGLSQPSVSRILAALERDLGSALLIRTTRAVRLTEVGRDYLARIELLLLELEEADHLARGGKELRGLLRLGVSSNFAVREVVPRLPSFLVSHPQLRIEMRVSDARQDLVAEGVDLALRLGPLADSRILARKLGQAPRLAIAAPAYLAKAPPLVTPADLAAHALILGPPGSRPGTWSFRKSDRRVSVQVEGRIVVGANEAAVATAVAGLGVTMTSLWGCRAELARGDLVQVLADWEMDEVEVHAVFPAGSAPKPAARTFADYFAAALKQGHEPAIRRRSARTKRR